MKAFFMVVIIIGQLRSCTFGQFIYSFPRCGYRLYLRGKILGVISNISALKKKVDIGNRYLYTCIHAYTNSCMQSNKQMEKKSIGQRKV